MCDEALTHQHLPRSLDALIEHQEAVDDVVADRGLLSLDNIDELGKITLPSGQALEFILAVQAGATVSLLASCKTSNPRRPRPSKSSLKSCPGRACGWWSRTTLSGPKSKRSCAVSALRPWRPKHKPGLASSMGKTAGVNGALADIERGFKVLKSEIEIAPVSHRLPQHIRAHAMVCFFALIVYRVMRQRLKLAKSDLSPKESAVATAPDPAA